MVIPSPAPTSDSAPGTRRYEIGHAPQEKLRLLARDFQGAELAAACAAIDVDSASAGPARRWAQPPVAAPAGASHC